MSETRKPKVIIIVGPTASGKTALSIEIAKKFDGEVISADSRQVYRGLDLGTGKVTEEEKQGVPHYLLDVADPEEIYSVADFVRDGRKAITEILKRTKLPIIAGGTFFYIDALIGRVEAPEVPPNQDLRRELESKSVDSLYTALLKYDERRAMDIDPHNKRRIIRALEIIQTLGKVPKAESNLIYDTLTIGIKLNKKQLHRNIHTRIHERVKLGMIEEVEELNKRGLSYERMDELGLEYRYISRFLTGKFEKEEMLKELETKTRQFAKRQMTWLKRDKSIRWFTASDIDGTLNCVDSFLKEK